MSHNNRLNYVKSPPIAVSESHSYVNLNQAHTGSRLPSYQESVSINGTIGNKRSITSPLPNFPGNFEISANIESPYKSTPQNWYSPPSSTRSDSRPPSLVDPKAINFKTNAKISLNSARPTSMASSIMPNQMHKLQTIDENSVVLPIDTLLQLCAHKNEDVQINAFGYLQHLTFNNPDNKMQIRDCNGLQTIIAYIDSDNNYVARAALGVLKNVSFTDFEMITTDIESLGAIHKLVNIVDATDDITQKELSIDILWNLSAKYNLKPTILNDVIQTLLNSVIIPDSGMTRQAAGNYVQGEEDIIWSTMLRNALGIIRNVSYESNAARTRLRRVDGLVDCILYIIFKSGNRESDMDDENQIAIIDTKIVENCVCVLRNLTYAIQEVVDPNYFEKRRDEDQKMKKTFKKNSSDDSRMISPPEPSDGVPKGVELLWNSKYIVSALFPILKNGANAVTLEAAAGVTQNLTAGDWKPSKEMQIQFRLQLALPTLIELVDFGTNEVIRSSATALRNLVQENFCCMLVGTNGLQNLTEKIPMSSRSKRIDATALAAILSTIYVIIMDQEEFMKNFITHKGANRCIYVRDIEEFIISDDPYPDKVKIFSQCILDLLWKTPGMQEMLKKNNIKQSDITNFSHSSANNSRGVPTQSNNADVSNNMRPHDSIVSDEDGRGAQYPRDERYLRDSQADIVSNDGLRYRNSRAYTSSSIAGYGDVRLPVAQIKASKGNGHLTTIQSESRTSSIVGARIVGSAPVSSSHARGPKSIDSHRKLRDVLSPRTLSPFSSHPIEAKPMNRKSSNNPSNGAQRHRSSHDSQVSNRHNPAQSNQRMSKGSDSSELYNYEYSTPKRSQNNLQQKRLGTSGV